jgi:hypothetical protein
LDREPRLGGVELRRRPVQHHRKLPELDGEQPLEPLARVLELRQDALDIRRIARVVARGEGLGLRLEPDGS